MTEKQASASTEVSQTVEVPTRRLAGGASSCKSKFNNMQIDPGHLQSLTSIHHIPPCSETASPPITILQKGTWGDEMLQIPSWSGSIFTGGLCARSWLSGNLGKTALRLTEIIRMYLDTSLKTVHRKGICFSSPLGSREGKDGAFLLHRGPCGTV